jgi:hypothetical protein
MTALTLLDSGGSQIAKGAVCVVACRADGITVIPQGQDTEEHWSYGDVRQLEVGGPGAVRRNAGMWGFGVGGIIAATGINRATTKTSINTLVKLVTTRAEYVFVSHVYGVQPLQTSLAPVFTRMRAAQSAGTTVASESTGSPVMSISGQLRELAQLHEDGVLTDQEFDAKKADVLARM